MIFANELAAVTAEETQLEQLLQALRQKKSFFQQIQGKAQEHIQGLSWVVGHAKENLGTDAITSLKTAVLTLFADGDGGNDGGGNQPAAPDDPTPRSHPLKSGDSDEAEQPQTFTPGSIIADANGSFGIVVGGNNLGMCVDWLGLGSCPNPASGKGVWYNWAKDNHALASLKPAAHDQVKLLTTEEFLQFQTWDKDQLDEYWDGEWVSDYGCEYRWGGATINRWIVVFAQSCEWASPLATPLASLVWENAPLLGQHCSVSFEDNENKDTSEGETMPKQESTELVLINSYVGCLKLKCNGQILSAYCWFAKKAIAQSWLKFLEPLATQIEMRESQRNSSWKWEIKLTGLSMRQLERLSKQQLWDKADKDRSLEESSESPAQAAGLEPPSDWGKVQQPEESKLPPCPFAEGDIVNWNSSELRVVKIGVEILYCVFPHEPEGTKHHTSVPIAGCSLVKSAVQQTEPENLGEGDVCQVLGGRYEGQVGTVASFNRYFEYPVSLNLPGGHVKKFLLNEVKLVSKNEASQSRQGLHSGQVLLGGKVATTGNYTGLRRENAIVNARNGLENKLAAMELVKSGVSPEEAMAAVTGSTTASDDYDF